MNVYNIPLERCHKLILEYQISDDPLTFWTLLVKFDRLILYSIIQLKKQYALLAEEELQELYHIGVIGLKKSFYSWKDTANPEDLPSRIAAYVKQEIKTAYRTTFQQKSREVQKDISDVEWLVSKERKTKSTALKKFFARCDIRTVLALDVLTQEEKGCIVDYYLKGEKYKTISKKRKLKEHQVRFRIKKGIKKLQKIFQKDKKFLVF